MVMEASGKFNRYVTEIIANSIPESFISFYIAASPVTGKAEISYDCTGLTPLSSELINNTERRLLRKAVGDLFLSFIRCLDLLIPLTGLIWSPGYIFWDQGRKSIRMCITPYITDSVDLSLSSLGDGKIETILNQEIFQLILSSDEISSLCTAVKNNDEELLETMALRIRKEDPEELLKAAVEQKKSLKYKSLFVGVLILLSILGITNGNSLLWGLGCLLAVFLLYRILTEARETSVTEKATNNQITSDRKSIYFDEAAPKSDIISCLILKSQKMIGDKYVNKAIYTSKSTIGSDPFLSDVLISDSTISEIHIEITKGDNAYYVTDISKDNTTYLDHRRLEPDKPYEVKNGQVLRCGEYDFDIVIE